MHTGDAVHQSETLFGENLIKSIMSWVSYTTEQAWLIWNYLLFQYVFLYKACITKGTDIRIRT